MLWPLCCQSHGDWVAAWQGKKAPGRLEAIAGIHAAAVSVLELLGLQQGAPGALLEQLRKLALVRCVTGLGCRFVGLCLVHSGCGECMPTYCSEQ